MSTHPEVLWAQRSSVSAPDKNVIYLTVNLPDIVESTLEYALKSTGLSFKARTSSGQSDYAFNLEFFEEVDPESSTKRLTSRSFFVVLRKKGLKSEYWPRLTKEKVKTPFIKTDFSRWVDEDEQDGNPNFEDDFAGGMPGMDDGMGMGMDFSKMMEQAGSGGANAADVTAAESDGENDEDGDGPPPLEDA